MSDYLSAFASLHASIDAERKAATELERHATTGPARAPLAPPRRRTTNHKPKALTPEEQARHDWAAAIMALPAAEGRSGAVRMVLSAHGPRSMSINAVDGFLRSLKPDAETEPVYALAEPAAAPREAAANNRAMVRKAELRLTTLGLLADSGNAAARATANKLAYALRLAQTTNTPIAKALAMAHVDPSIMEG